MSDKWNAKNYSQFLDLRTRPARDLLAAIPLDFHPKTIYDLGCGPGNSTILLKQRWPHANIIGTDNSDSMLTEAQHSYPDIKFIKQDIQHFSPEENQKIDCLFANASLQWLSHHETLFPELLKSLMKGGWFGFQMPNNFHSPTHQTTIEILENHQRWHPLLKKLRYGKLCQPFYDLNKYYDLFTKTGISQLQLWETEYFQELDTHEKIFDWVKGTGLTPILSEMDEANQTQFSEFYLNLIRQKYPTQTNGKVLLRYRRVFMVGRCP